ncbi:hypothetical protein L2E82_06464 [Cichorium intybus]|uniref:Uncharacterized protein n=1 Tax=Cichorium intybus TaxID=13427 RepID=A0ACB9HBE8_CICIN|nr:hypothetical protein L2E82_06464 [Cichorium intybus]
MPLVKPFQDCSSSSSKGVKRKWSVRDGSMDMEAELPLYHSLSGSSSSSDSKASSATMSSLKETDEESSMDLELDFSLHLGNEKTSLKKKPSSSNKLSLNLQHQVDLELTLSSTPTSSVTSLSTITHIHHQQQRNIKSHGGGKGCVVKDCGGSARGRTDCCVKHGGGKSKTCKFEGCGKSGQDFCKAHGALVQDERVHGGATLGPLVLHDTKSGPLEKNMNVDGNDMTSSMVSEGRVHGGGLIAFLTSGSLDSQKWI